MVLTEIKYKIEDVKFTFTKQFLGIYGLYQCGHCKDFNGDTLNNEQENHKKSEQSFTNKDYNYEVDYNSPSEGVLYYGGFPLDESIWADIAGSNDPEEMDTAYWNLDWKIYNIWLFSHKVRPLGGLCIFPKEAILPYCWAWES